MYDFYYHPKVVYLLLSQAKAIAAIHYDQNLNDWPAPEIGPRPPYYINPRYEPYYPTI